MDELVAVCKALADRNRLRVIAALYQQGELCACQITELLGVTGATASRHLSALQGCGLITSRKEGRWIFFSKSREFGPGGTLELPGKWLKTEFSKSEELKKDAARLGKILSMDKTELCRLQRVDKCCS